MKKIEGSPKNLKQLLQNTKYSMEYTRSSSEDIENYLLESENPDWCI